MTVSTDFTRDSRALALEMHRFFSELDRRSRRRWRENVGGLPAKLADLRARLDLLLGGEARHEDDDAARTLRAHWIDLKHSMEGSLPATQLRSEWLAFRARVVPAYEALANSLNKISLPVPSLRPKNYVRNAFHVLSALTCLLMVELAPWDWVIAVSCSGALVAWTLELGRRFDPRLNRFLMRCFGLVAHPQEATKVNSATWYASAAAVLALTHQPIPCALAMIVLGRGDPAAAIIGRRWGRLRWVNGRSVEGTTAFIVAAALGSLLFLTLAHGIALVPAIAMASGAAVLAAFAELWSRGLDDNLTIPVMGWIGAFAAAQIF